MTHTPQTMGRLGGLARAKALTKAQRLASSQKANKAKANKQRHEGLSSKRFRILG